MLRQALPSCAICSWDYRLLYSVSFIWGYPLNALVQTRDTAFDAAAYAIQADLMDQIKFQWYVEMYGEGFRYNDLKHLNMALARNGSNHDSALLGGLMQVAAGDPNWQWKIPLDELNANPAIQGQNP